MPASYSPEHILIKAILSLCALFIFACILNTNAEKNSSFIGSTYPSCVFLFRGDDVILRKCSRKVCTPKFVSAEPKNTGLNSPADTFSMSKSSLAPSKSSISFLNISA